MIDIKKLSRSEIRYALYRNRSGAPDKEHINILAFFSKELKNYGMVISDFPEVWDVSMTNPLEIVSGHLLIPLKNKIEESLFEKDGTLKK